MPATDPEQIQTFLKGLSLFNWMEPYQIEQLAALCLPVARNPNQVIVEQGSKTDGFYIIFEGQVSARRELSRQDTQIDVFVPGDFFGEDTLIQNQGEPATITVLVPTTFLYLDAPAFFQVVSAFPEVGAYLKRFVKSHDYQRRLYLEWLNDDEVVYQIRRRHMIYLLITLLLPGTLTLIGLSLAGAAWIFRGAGLFSNLFLFVAAVLLGLGLGWGIWNWADWGNDYYIVTNQRVVWVEKIIWLYDSRIEAPMTTILSVNVLTSFIGRLFQFGDVIVTTYTGKVRLEAVSNPYQLSSLISEYRQRSQQDLQKADLQEMRRSIRHIIHVPEAQEAEQPPLPAGAKARRESRQADEVREPTFFDKYFGNIFKTRIEEGRTITYRKHWLILFKKAWVPALITLVWIFLVAGLGVVRVMDEAFPVPLLTICAIGPLPVLLILLPWLTYHYIDWRNDIYQVTDRSIFDIERRPFGTETRKSAPLENILSLEHQRPGFLGYVLNVGHVVINVGETRFTFNYVVHPALVQQDIFNRMHALKLQKQREEVARERERILKLIEIYHEEVGKEP